MNKFRLHVQALVLAGSIMTGMLMPTMTHGASKCIEDIVHELNKSNPAHHAELASHIATLERLIHSFLSKENTESFSAHFEKMQKAINEFKTTAAKCGGNTAKRLRASLDNFINTMRNHTSGKSNCITLGLDLIKHEDLLPKGIRDGYGPFELPGRLSHRLNCK